MTRSFRAQVHWDISLGFFGVGLPPKAFTLPPCLIKLLLGADMPLGGLVRDPWIRAFDPSMGLPAASIYSLSGPLSPCPLAIKLLHVVLLFGDVREPLELLFDFFPFGFSKRVLIVDC